MMLSRIADSLFWIGRYLERAEHTARILEVHLLTGADDPSVDPGEVWRLLLAAMGAEPIDFPDEDDIMRVLAHDVTSPCSMVHAIGGARDGARRARETLSTEIWEAINTTWNSVSGAKLTRMRPATAFRLVRERCNVIAGIADGTMSHDQGWQFMLLGRSLERVDMTARLILSTAQSGSSERSWAGALRACGAHHAYVRTYRGSNSAHDSAEFLLLDRLFPRSVVFTLSRAQAALEALDVGERRAGHALSAEQQLGRARAELEYRPLAETLEDLPERMQALQERVAEAAEAIHDRYFEGSQPSLWHGRTTD